MPDMQVQAQGDTLVFSRVAGLPAQASSWHTLHLRQHLRGFHWHKAGRGSNL